MSFDFIFKFFLQRKKIYTKVDRRFKLFRNFFVQLDMQVALNIKRLF